MVLVFTFAACVSFTVFTGSTASAALAIEKVSSTDATVAVDKLNIRQGPAVSFPVIHVLNKGQALKVLSKVGNWYAVYDLQNGCIGAVDGKYIKFSNATPASLTGAPEDKTVIAPSDISKDEQALLDLVNKSRKDAGVAALALDKNLLNTARLKAKDMADNNYFSHSSPTFGSPFDMMKQYGIAFKTAGENIAGNQTVEGAFKAWMASEGHKKNILNDGFSFIGIGVASSNTYGKILVQQFIGK